MFGLSNDFGSTRQAITAFGTLFNDISVLRKDSSGTLIQTIKVPILYGPKNKWYYRIFQDPNAGNVSDVPSDVTQLPVQVVLPVICYELEDIEYDSDRMVSTVIQDVNVVAGDNTILKTRYNPIPVKFHFALNIMVKNMDDGLQIIEAIIPFFRPYFTMRIKDPTGFPMVKDVPVTLQYPVKPDIEWTGDFSDTRSITWTIPFQMDYYIFGPVIDSKEILEADLTYYVGLPGDQSNPALTQKSVPNPTTATADQVFGFTDTITPL